MPVRLAYFLSFNSLKNLVMGRYYLYPFMDKDLRPEEIRSPSASHRAGEW